MRMRELDGRVFCTNTFTLTAIPKGAKQRPLTDIVCDARKIPKLFNRRLGLGSPATYDEAFHARRQCWPASEPMGIPLLK